MWMNWRNTCMWRYRKANESISPVSLALSLYACVVSSALCLSSKLNYSFDVAIRDGFSPLCRDHLHFWNMFCKGTHLYLRGILRIHTQTQSGLSVRSLTSSASPNVSQSIPRSMSRLFSKDSNLQTARGFSYVSNQQLSAPQKNTITSQNASKKQHLANVSLPPGGHYLWKLHRWFSVAPLCLHYPCNY